MIPIDNDEGITTEKQELALDKTVIPCRNTPSLVLLTLGLGGLQGVFSVQYGNGSAYLTSFGLSNPVMALVWLAGPISGAVFQPYFCLCSDRHQSKWGRRRPFIVGGTAATILSLLGLAWADDLGIAVAHVLGTDQQSRLTANTAAAFAILFVSALNIAVQPVQGGLRALIVDSCPKDQQDAANAWAGRIISIANVLSYLCGYIDLPYWLPYLGHTQFRVLCVTTVMALAISVAITCWAVKESPAVLYKADIYVERGLFCKLGYLFMSFRRLPSQVQRVCMIQFFAWMGWFPFLFYVNIYISGKLLENFPTNVARLQPTKSVTPEAEMAARSGSLGMLIFAVMSLFAGIVIPMLVQPKDRPQTNRYLWPLLARWIKVISTWTSSTHHLWMISHILYASCMLATMLVSSLSGTFFLVGIAGISWAITVWAPYAIISNAILVDDDIRQNDTIECSPSVGDYGEPRPGTVIGLHNVAIAMPQVLAALLCGFVFWLCDQFGLAGLKDSVGWVLRIGGLSALVAAFLATRLGDSDEPQYCTLTSIEHA